MPTTKQVYSFPDCSLATAQLCIPAGRTVPAIVNLQGAERVTIQGATVGTTAWSSAVVTVRVSNSADGPWVSIPGNPVTMTAAGMTQPIDVSQYAYLALECTTAQASVVADFWICTYAGDVPWAASMFPLGRTSGKRYLGVGCLNGSNGALTTNTLYAVPFWVGPPQRFTGIAIASTSTVATSVVRLGLYADDGLCKPGNLIIDAGTVDTSTTGEKTVSFNMILSGLVWVAGVAQTAAAQTTRMGLMFSQFAGVGSVFSASGTMAYNQTGVTGALPSAWGSTYNENASANAVPLMYLIV